MKIFDPHFVHTAVIHFAIALPFVTFFFLIFCRMSFIVGERKAISNLVFLLSFFQTLSAFAAFYSGSFLIDTLIDPLTHELQDSFEWHYLSGRLVLFSSTIASITCVIAALAQIRRKHFFILAVVASLVSCGLVVFSGYTGGSLVHEEGIHRFY